MASASGSVMEEGIVEDVDAEAERGREQLAQVDGSL
jgi:hypothetical protein